MISEERLKELIEQERTIYTPDTMWESVGEITLNKKMKIEDGKLDGEIGNLGLEGAMCFCCVPLEELYEFKADAEEFLKYGNVTRTEKFPYVSWEDACDGTTHHIVFTTPKHQKVEMIVCDGYIDIIGIYNITCSFNMPLTRENYHKALDLAVKLFKGEEV